MATGKPDGETLSSGSILKALGLGLVGLMLGLLVLTIIRMAAMSSSLPTPTPAPPTPGAIGSTGHLRTVPGYGELLIWVDPLGMAAWNRAYENRDEKGEMQVLDVFEQLHIPEGTLVRVTNRSGDAIQVEILSGDLAGRRGWTDPLNLIP